MWDSHAPSWCACTSPRLRQARALPETLESDSVVDVSLRSFWHGGVLLTCGAPLTFISPGTGFFSIIVADS